MKKVTKAVILAGGFGTRFLPATLCMAKEMFPIVDKPILYYHLKECVDSGITDVLIVSSKNKIEIDEFLYPSEEIINNLKANNKMQFLDEYYEVRNKLNIQVIYQMEKNGSGGAVAIAENWFNEPFVLFNGDDVFDCGKQNVTASTALIDAYAKTQKSAIILKPVSKEVVSRYGMVRINKKLTNQVFELSEIVEKPKPADAPSEYATLGRYLLTPEIFDKLRQTSKRGNELYASDAINLLAKDARCVGVDYDGEYYDCGNKLEFAKCTTHYLLKHPDFGKDYRKYLKELIKNL